MSNILLHFDTEGKTSQEQAQKKPEEKKRRKNELGAEEAETNKKQRKPPSLSWIQRRRAYALQYNGIFQQFQLGNSADFKLCCSLV